MTRRRTTADIPSQAGIIVVVTGANSGLGLATAPRAGRGGGPRGARRIPATLGHAS